MTNYGWANEEQRSDRELKDLIFKKLTDDYEAYRESAEFLQKIYDNAVLNRVEVFILLKKAKWNRDFLKGVLEDYPEKDTYLGNQAAFMKDYEIDQLKAKYGDKA